MWDWIKLEERDNDSSEGLLDWDRINNKILLSIKGTHIQRIRNKKWP
jgi:hypothetical protein